MKSMPILSLSYGLMWAVLIFTLWFSKLVRGMAVTDIGIINSGDDKVYIVCVRNSLQSKP